MDTQELKTLITDWLPTTAEPVAIYAVADRAVMKIFSIHGSAPNEILNCKPPTKLIKMIEEKIATEESFFAYRIDPESGALTTVAKLTEERRRVFELVKVIPAFEASVRQYSQVALGVRKAAKILKAVKASGVIGGTDVRSTYDSCSYGGGILNNKSGEIAFGNVTLYDGRPPGIDIFFSAEETEFKSWLAKQSELSLACAPNISISRLPVSYNLHASLITAIRRLP